MIDTILAVPLFGYPCKLSLTHSQMSVPSHSGRMFQPFDPLREASQLEPLAAPVALSDEVPKLEAPSGGGGSLSLRVRSIWLWLSKPMGSHFGLGAPPSF